MTWSSLTEKPKNQQRVTLKRRYNLSLSGGEDLQWFLGIEVHRDRAQRLIWLSQSSYIDKIVKLADTKQPDETPMAKIELFPYEERASGQVLDRRFDHPPKKTNLAIVMFFIHLCIFFSSLCLIR
jgi:hypothetical protein